MRHECAETPEGIALVECDDGCWRVRFESNGLEWVVSLDFCPWCGSELADDGCWEGA